MSKEPSPELLCVFIFHNISAGIQAKLAFSKELRHCNTITYDGRDWINLDFDSSGLLTRRVNCKNTIQLLRRLRGLETSTAILVCSVGGRARSSWRPWWVRSCNEIARYASGVDIGFTFNPRHLYKKLIKYNDKRNYQILYAWRRSDGIFRQ